MQREQRGPMALFGALVAIGLGPALWLGVQIGDVTVSPPKPPVVQSEQKQSVTNPRGGEAAGAADPEPVTVPEPQRKARNMPMTEPPRPKPSKTTKAPESPAPEQTSKPVESTEPTETTPADDATSTPPDEESTTTPDDPDEGDGNEGSDQSGTSGQG
ncbi:hypothetical protein [Actinoplanes sp. NPDC049265]|uniref:hypothetical protein n=1 Tax=Actinoplanes sp. NPDC049265 TaxID=3363902 RepID=UPI00371BC310